MPSTFTTNTGIEKPGSGEQSGTWGTTVNTNMDIIDRALNGVKELALTGTSTTLSTTDATLSDGMYRYIRLTGALSATHTIDILPADAQKIYFIEDATTGGQTITITQGAGSHNLTTGGTQIIYADGNGTVDEIVVGTSFTVTNTGTGYGTLSFSNGVLDFAKVTNANIASALTGGTDIEVTTDGTINFTGSAGTVNNSTITVGTGNGISGGFSFTTNSANAVTGSLTVSAGNGLSQTTTGLQMSGSYTGSFSATQNITAYASDERLKDFHGTIPDALERISRINGYYYTLNKTAMDLGFDNLGMEAGVSAQEIEAVLPEVVKPAPINKEKGTDYKTVQYERIVALLIEAVKELKNEIEELKNGSAN